jgi:hypothetical protein
VTAAVIAVVFLTASVAWASMATMGFWAPSRFRLHPEWHDVIPGVIAVVLLLIALQFIHGVFAPDQLPWGVAKRPRTVSVTRFGVHLITALLIGFLGFLLWSASTPTSDFMTYDYRGRTAGFDDPRRDWMAPLQRYSGLALILVGCFTLATRTRQFMIGRHDSV